MNLTDDNKLSLVNTLLYVINKLGKADFHKIFKILYFAEQEHIKLFGKRLINDDYIAMEYGPVPSKSYNLLSDAVHGDWHEYFEPEGKYTVSANVAPDLDYLSESEIKCIDKSISEYGSLSFKERTEKSHDEAYNATALNYPMDIINIGRAGGATEDTLEYLRDNIEANGLFK